MKTKTPLFPKYTMYWNEEDQTHHLEFDGLDGVPTPYRLVLTDIGSRAIETALCNLPIQKTNGKFWGYKDQPVNEDLFKEITKVDGLFSFASPYKLMAVGNGLYQFQTDLTNESTIAGDLNGNIIQVLINDLIEFQQ